MPNRIVREGILTSERIEQLDPPAEVFYRRLLSKVDDHGLYDARAAILRASLYPLRLDRVREADCSRWIAACVKAGLIVLYEAAGKPYLKVLNTQWQARSDPKYPLPPPESNCVQLQTSAGLDVVVVVDGDVDKNVGDIGSRDQSRSPANGSSIAYIPLNDGSEFGISLQHVEEFEKAYPAVDCKQTLQEIRAWCLANPTKRKTKSGALRFVNSWLSREQNKAH